MPWHQVGPGWILAEWTASTPAAGTAATAVTATLLLVDPTGGRYDLGPVPPGTRLSGWSGDGARALFAQGQSTTRVVVMELGSGATTTVTPGGPSFYDAVRFTRPDGLALLAQGVPLRRLTLTGALELTYPSSYSTQADSTATGTAVESPEGTELALGAKGGVDLVGNGGGLLGFVPMPTGGTTPTGCTLLSWWEPTAVLLACGGQLWSVPVDGSPPSPVTAAATGGVYLGGWDLPSGVLVEQGACGSTWLDSVNAAGTAARIDIAGGTGSVEPVGTDGNRIAVVATVGCDDVGPTAAPPDVSLDWYEPSTGALSVLMSTEATGAGAVLTAVAYGATPPA